jgi:hypothetical protein
MSEYIVQPGDTLSQLAIDLLGEGHSYQDLMRYNSQISDPDLIEVGDSIYYPEEEAASPQPSNPGAPYPAPMPPDYVMPVNKNKMYYIAGAVILAAALLMGNKKKS